MRVEDTEWFRFSAEARKRISEAGEEEKSGAKFYFEARKMIETVSYTHLTLPTKA